MPLGIEDVLGPVGRLARALPGWELRDDQLAMARAVEAHSIDKRVPYTDSIKKWTAELIEMHALQ